MTDDNLREFDDDVFVEEDDDPIEPTIKSPDENLTVDLGKYKFAALMSIFRIMKLTCQDMIIKSGRVTQFNTQRNFIIIVDLRPILGDIDLIIPSISNKFSMLEPFKKQNVDVFLDVYDKGYTFRDDMSNLHFKKAIESFSEKSMTYDEVFEKAKIDDDRTIFTYMWDKMALDRLTAYSEGTAINQLNVAFYGDSAKFVFIPMENVSTYSIDITTLSDELDDTSLDKVTAPFPVQAWTSFLEGGIEEINTELYYRNVKSETEGVPTIMVASASLPIADTDLTIDIKLLVPSFIKPLNRMLTYT